MARIDSRTCRSKDGAEVTIRTAVEADAAAVLTMATEYIDENAGMVWAPGEYRKTEAETRERLRTMLEDPLKLFLVAELDREIVGNIDFQVARGCEQHTRESSAWGCCRRCAAGDWGACY